MTLVEIARTQHARYATWSAQDRIVSAALAAGAGALIGAAAATTSTMGLYVAGLLLYAVAVWNRRLGYRPARAHWRQLLRSKTFWTAREGAITALAAFLLLDGAARLIG